MLLLGLSLLQQQHLWLPQPRAFSALPQQGGPGHSAHTYRKMSIYALLLRGERAHIKELNIKTPLLTSGPLPWESLLPSLLCLCSQHVLDNVQRAFQCLPGWTLYTISGSPVSLLPQCHSEKGFPGVQTELPLIHFVPCAAIPATGIREKSLALPSSQPPYRYLRGNWSPQQVCACQETD